MTTANQIVLSFLQWVGLTLVAIISFWSQAVVTEDRFVPALQVLVQHYNIPDNVAGATFMAAGASCPELLASITSLFITHSSLGVGTIVGSEIFNQLIICAGAVQAARNHKLQLNKAVVLRDVFFYGLSLLCLYIALSDRRPKDNSELNHIFIRWPHAVLLLGCYIVYVIVCANFERIRVWKVCLQEDDFDDDDDDGNNSKTNNNYCLEEGPPYRQTIGACQSSKPSTTAQQQQQAESITPAQGPSPGKVIDNAYMQYGDQAMMEQDLKNGAATTKTLLSPPDAASPCIFHAIHIFLYPFKFLIYYTIPDPNNAHNKMPIEKPSVQRASMSVVLCIVWLVVGSYAMVISLEQLGLLLHVPDTVMGVTVSAAGTSLPNFIASQVAAREGLGDMAVSNAFGSNIFNIFVGLGLPWTIYTLFVESEYSDLQDDEILTSLLIMVFILVVFVVAMCASRFKLHRWHAYIFVGLYFLYVLYAVADIFVDHLNEKEDEN